MRPCIRRVRALVLTIGLLLPCSAAAQLSVSADFTVASRYVWRGTTRARGPVTQIAAYVTFAGPAFLSVGSWTNVELHRADAGEPSVVGTGRRGLGEVDVWGAISNRSGPLDWAAGVSHYRLDHIHAAVPTGNAFATTEAWFTVTGSAWPLIPRVGGWLDFDEVRGRYYELGVAYPVPLHPLGTPIGSIYLAINTGISDGQAQDNGGSGTLAYFRSDGVTHIDLAASATADLSALLPGSLHAAVHYHISRDAATRLNGPAGGREQRRGWWAELSLSATTLATR